MKRPGDHILLWMLATQAAVILLHPPVWTVLIIAIAVSRYYNQQDEKQNA